MLDLIHKSVSGCVWW